MSANATAQGGIEPPRLPLFGDPIGTIRASLHSHHLPKWGLLIYRCDYRCDANWESFMATLNWNMTDALSLLKATDLLASLDMRVVADQSALDGASVDHVRNVFKAWVESAEGKEETKDVPFDRGGAAYPRYTYCVHADADAVDSVVRRAPQSPKSDRKMVGYVNLVRRNIRDCADYSGDREVEEENEEDGGDWNVVRAPVYSLFGPETYGDLYREEVFDQMRTRKACFGVFTA